MNFLWNSDRMVSLMKLFDCRGREGGREGEREGEREGAREREGGRGERD